MAADEAGLNKVHKINPKTGCKYRREKYRITFKEERSFKTLNRRL
jgi:hypothetical protein